MTQSADTRQHGGAHYTRMAVQPWNVVDTWPLEQRIGFYRGNALKYIMRLNDKDAPTDNVGKAAHYCEKLAEVLREADSQPELPYYTAIDEADTEQVPNMCLVRSGETYTDDTECDWCGHGPCKSGANDPRIPTVICPVTEVNCGQLCNSGECRRDRNAR